MKIAALILLVFPMLLTAQVDGRKPVPPGNVREADVMFSKRVWRVIDLHEKQNGRMVWPVAPINKILYDAALNGQLVAYRNDSLRSRYTPKQFAALGNDTTYVETPIDPNDPSITRLDTVTTGFDPIEKIQYLVLMEDWLFDKKLSTMKPRIIAIAPLYRLHVAGMDLSLVPLAWFRYEDSSNKEPDCRDLHITKRVFNRENSRSTFTFDDLFEQRQFRSFVIKVSNKDGTSILQDPDVKKRGLEALIEAERVKNENYEFDANQFED